jgi:hypothetical protein
MLPRNIGAQVKVERAIKPQAAGAGTINGPAIDRLGFLSAVLHVGTGDVSGSPSAQTVDAKLQESADGATGWTDISGAAISQITSANAQAEKDVSLSGAKRYIRAVVTVSFTGGTSPTIGAAATVVLGGKDVLPA